MEQPRTRVPSAGLVERRYERFEVFIGSSLDCPVRGLSGIQQTTCTVRNISRGGAAIHVGPSFESIADMFILDVPLASGTKLPINCQVVERKSGMLHLRFLKDLEERQIAAVLQAHA